VAATVDEGGVYAPGTETDDSQGDGPGFGVVAALLALLAGAFVIRRRA
jgi:PGF-CTERM protein